MREREKRIRNIRTIRRVEKKKNIFHASFLKNRDFIAGNLETEYNKISEVNNTLLVLAKVLKEVILENGK